MLSNPIPTKQTQTVDQQRSANGRGLTILLVEDEYAVREFVRLVLEHSGYAVVPADDGDQGIAEYVADPDRFALVLTDVIMPNRTGPELVEVIHRIRPGLPVIFMSAYTGGTGANPIEMPPGATVLEKPFSLDELLAAVTQTISQKATRG